MKPAHDPLAALRREVALDIGNHKNQDAQQHRDFDDVIEKKLKTCAQTGGNIQSDCGKKIHIFGEEKLNKVASKYGYELLGNLPMDGKLAALCDKGIIELMENDFLDKAAEAIENKFVQK